MLKFISIWHSWLPLARERRIERLKIRRPVDRDEENLIPGVKVAYASNIMNLFTPSVGRPMLSNLQEERSVMVT